MRKKNIQRLMIAAVLLIVLPFVISQFMLECLTKLFAMDPDQASTIASTGQVIVQALAAVMIIVQLGQDNREAKQQSEIEAARFLFQYNQSFLEDENVIEIERLIDKEYMDEIDGIPRTNSVINNNNRQYVVNYLVYLEGLAPLVLNGTLKLEVIDDLMSYRFFLAVNNPEIQKKHLFVFPDDYRGCFKLYKAWKAYRIAYGREILQAQYSLDHWHDFDLYANDTNSGKIEIEKGASVKSYEDIAAIMFGADPYIFPAAFSRLTIAKTVLPEFFADVNGPFGSNNMYIAKSDGRLAGVLCFFDKDTKCGMDYRDLKGKYAILPNSYIYTCENYFEKILNNIYSEPDNSLYLHPAVPIALAHIHRACHRKQELFVQCVSAFLTVAFKLLSGLNVNCVNAVISVFLQILQVHRMYLLLIHSIFMVFICLSSLLLLKPSSFVAVIPAHSKISFEF